MHRAEEPASAEDWIENHSKLYTAAHHALVHFHHLDMANAEIHTSVVRYSPITFRLAEALSALGWASATIDAVVGHRGQYEEDPGR